MNDAANRYGLLLPLFCLALNLLPEGDTALLAYQHSTLIEGEWWRLWTGHFVHFSPSHALTNGAMLIMLSLLFARTYGEKTLALIYVFGPVVISLMLLWLVPDMVAYRGASALDAILFASLLAGKLIHVRGKMAVPFVLLAGAWLVKLSFEIGDGASFSSLPASVHVAWQAHVSGMLIGIVLGLCMEWEAWHKPMESIGFSRREEKWG